MIESPPWDAVAVFEDMEADPPPASRPVSRTELILQLARFEGPLDLLLDLARRRKVDLRPVSMLELADQYLQFLQHAGPQQVRLGADYLAMAAWLTYLKSCLLLPQDDEARAGADELAALLAARLERLEAMRQAGERLLAQPRLGRQFFARGMPVRARVQRQQVWQAGLADLLGAYAQVRARDNYAPLHLQRPPVVGMEQALGRLRSLLPATREWRGLVAFLPEEWREPKLLRSAIGGLFTGALELARTGEVELSQHRAFGPLRLRSAAAGNAARGDRAEGVAHAARAG